VRANLELSLREILETPWTTHIPDDRLADALAELTIVQEYLKKLECKATHNPRTLLEARSTQRLSKELLALCKSTSNDAKFAFDRTNLDNKRKAIQRTAQRESTQDGRQTDEQTAIQAEKETAYKDLEKLRCEAPGLDLSNVVSLVIQLIEDKQAGGTIMTEIDLKKALDQCLDQNLANKHPSGSPEQCDAWVQRLTAGLARFAQCVAAADQ